MDILVKTTNTPKTVAFPDGNSAAIASSCLRSLAKGLDIDDFHVRKIKNSILVWRGQLEQIPFRHPYKPMPSRRWNDGFGTVDMRERA